MRASTPIFRLAIFAFALALVAVACGTTSTTGESPASGLPETSASEFEAHLQALERPAVVNVWASWCLPCRAEAPLLAEAHAKYSSQVEFIGVDVQDNRPDAQAFLDEFGLDFEHFFDRDREVPQFYGGIGTPITFFFGPNGELVRTHNGVVDERTLALNIDEIINLP